MHAVKTGHAVGPFIGNRQTVDTADLITGAARIIRADFKTGSENNAIDLIGNIVKHHGIFGDPRHAATVRINQMHIGAVETGEIIIVKTWPFTKQAIIRFQCFRRLRIFHHVIDAVANALHFVIIGNFHCLGDIHESYRLIGEIFFQAVFIELWGSKAPQCPKRQSGARGCFIAQAANQ